MARQRRPPLHDGDTYLAPFKIDFPEAEEIERHEIFTVKRYLRA